MTPPLGTFIGLATLDVVHRVIAPPRPDEKVTALRQDVAAGGPAANAAVTFAALGGRARLVTALGCSAIAQVIRAELESCGVDVVDVAPEVTAAPAVSAVSVTESTGDRSIVSLDAAGLQESLGRDVAAPGDLAAHLAGAAVVLVDGHHPALATAALELVRAGPRPPLVVLDAGRWRPVMYRLIPGADVVICSADFRMPGTTEPAASAAVLRARGVSTVVTTYGPDPVRWWTADDDGSVPVPRVAARDTLGAGDVFHGAYCWYAAGPQAPLPELLAAAAQVASLRCSTIGPREWLRQVVDRAAGNRATR